MVGFKLFALHVACILQTRNVHSHTINKP